MAYFAMLLALASTGCFIVDEEEDYGYEDTCDPSEYWIDQDLTARVAWGNDSHLVHWVSGDSDGASTLEVGDDGGLGTVRDLREGAYARSRLVFTGAGYRLFATTTDPQFGIMSKPLTLQGEPAGNWQVAASWEGPSFSLVAIDAVYDGEYTWVAVTTHMEPRIETVRLARFSAAGRQIGPPIIVAELIDSSSIASIEIERVGDVVWVVWEYASFDQAGQRRRIVEGARVAIDGTVLAREVLIDAASSPMLAARDDSVLLVASVAGQPVGMMLDASGPVEPQPTALGSTDGMALQLVASDDPPGYLLLARKGERRSFPCPSCSIDVFAISAVEGAFGFDALANLPGAEAVVSVGETGFVLASVTEQAFVNSGTSTLHVQTMEADGSLGTPSVVGESQGVFVYEDCF